jgi:hypothetical protein
MFALRVLEVQEVVIDAKCMSSAAVVVGWEYDRRTTICTQAS